MPHASCNFTRRPVTIALLTSILELVEAYEGADAAGATTRRYAIINEDKQVLMNRVGGPAYK